MGLPLKIIVDSPVDGRERYAAKLILVRPDQFVAWTSNDQSGEPAKVLARAAGYE
jgi:hypothetical protein